MKKHFKKFCYRLTKKRILGIILMLIGILVILKVVPTSIWFFLFGIVFLSFGIFLFKSG